jgi:hypothetical protein
MPAALVQRSLFRLNRWLAAGLPYVAPRLGSERPLAARGSIGSQS